MSSKIQQINSCPDYISKFIQLNMEQLCKIYDEGIDLYAGFGVDFNVIESIAINASYDILGFSDDPSSFSNTSSLLSLGITATF